MTLVELLATVTIIAILTAAAVPPFRRLSGRQSLLTAQKTVQSLLNRMNQLALAPTDTAQAGYDTVGYGLLIWPKAVTAVTIGPCQVLTPTDTIALVDIVKFADGSIDDFLHGLVDPVQNRCLTTPVDPSRYPNTFTRLPVGVDLSADSTPAPPRWLIVRPLEPVGQNLGPLCSPPACATGALGLIEPLANLATARLRLRQTTLADPTRPTAHLCREIALTRNVAIDLAASVVAGGCR